MIIQQNIMAQQKQLQEQLANQHRQMFEQQKIMHQNLNNIQANVQNTLRNVFANLPQFNNNFNGFNGYNRRRQICIICKMYLKEINIIAFLRDELTLFLYYTISIIYKESNATVFSLKCMIRRVTINFQFTVQQKEQKLQRPSFIK